MGCLKPIGHRLGRWEKAKAGNLGIGLKQKDRRTVYLGGAGRLTGTPGALRALLGSRVPLEGTREGTLPLQWLVGQVFCPRRRRTAVPGSGEDDPGPAGVAQWLSARPPVRTRKSPPDSWSGRAARLVPTSRAQEAAGDSHRCCFSLSPLPFSLKSVKKY